MNDLRAGQIRVVGSSESGHLTDNDCRIETMLSDGTWMRLTGLVSVNVRIRPNDFVFVELVAIASMLNVEGINSVTVETEPLPRVPWWRRLFS